MTQYPSSLLEEVRRLVQESPDDEADLERAVSLLDEAAAQPGADTEAISRWRGRVEKARRRLQAIRIYEETKKACERLWAQEQSLVKAHTSPQKILDDIFNRARNLARQAAEAYPESALLDGLKNDAETQYELMHKRYMVPDTAAETHGYAELIEKLKKEDPEQMMPWTNPDGSPRHPVSIREAIQLVEEQAVQYAREKADEYGQKAQAALREHRPRRALEELGKYRNLYLLPEGRKNALESFRKKKIQPELERLEQAEKHLASARLSNDLQDAWDTLQKAIETYPWAADIPEVRLDLARRTLNRNAALLKEARRDLEQFRQSRQNDSLQKASDSLQQALDLLERIPDPDVLQETREGKSLPQARVTLVLENKERLSREAEEVEQEVKTAQKFLEAVQTQIENLEKMLEESPNRAQAALNTLLATYQAGPYEQYGALEKRFPDIKSLQRRLDAHRDFERSLGDLDIAFESGDEAEIRQALEEVDDIQKVASNEKQKKQVEKRTIRLKGRLDFLSGERARQEGDIQAALDAYQRVVRLREHPDREAAQRRIDALNAERENEERVMQALDEAERHLREGQPAEAYRALESVEKLPTRQKEALHAALRKARRQWEEALLAQGEALQQAPSPLPQDLRGLAKQLMALPEPRSVRGRNKARELRARAWALEARQYVATGKWEQARECWQSALQEVPLEDVYLQGFYEASLQVARITLERAEGVLEARGIIDDLKKAFPDRTEPFELEAEYERRQAANLMLDVQARLEHIRRARSALRVVVRAVGDSAALRGKVRDLTASLDELEAICQEQMVIEEHLRPEASRPEIAEALSRLKDLQKQFPRGSKEHRALSEWGKKKADALLATLEERDHALDDSNLWERFDVRSKILLLAPNDRRARELLREIPPKMDTLVGDIQAAVEDYRQGLLAKGNTAWELLDSQQEHMEKLRERAEELYEIAGLVKEHTPDSKRLREEILDARVQLQSPLRHLRAFRMKIRQMEDALMLATQDDDWHDFDEVLTKINNEGFGNHRAVRLLLERRDAVRKKREKLKELSEQLRTLVEQSKGEDLFKACALLDMLEKEDEMDEFGLQATLAVTIPWSRVTLEGTMAIRSWLEAYLSKVEEVQKWLGNSGLSDLMPNATFSDSRNIIPWKEEKNKIERLLDKGEFEPVRVLLDVILGSRSSSSVAIQKRWNEKVKNMLQSYQGLLPLEDARDEIARFPMLDESTRSPFLKDILEKARAHLQEVQAAITDLNQMQSEASHREQQYRSARIELQQALEEFRQAKRRRFLVFSDTGAAKQAEARARKAIATCREAAPHHTELQDIDLLLE